MGFWQIVRADLARLGPVDLSHFLKQIFFHGGECFEYVFWLRVVQFVNRRRWCAFTFGLIPRLVLHLLEYKYRIHISPKIPIGPGLLIVHGEGTYLNCRSIGVNFSVWHRVTLGFNGKDRRTPIVGNDVWIYTGAVVAGGVSLGDGCAVGANSFCAKDVPAGAVVAGVPAKVIRGSNVHGC